MRVVSLYQVFADQPELAYDLALAHALATGAVAESPALLLEALPGQVGQAMEAVAKLDPTAKLPLTTADLARDLRAGEPLSLTRYLSWHDAAPELKAIPAAFQHHIYLDHNRAAAEALAAWSKRRPRWRERLPGHRRDLSAPLGPVSEPAEPASDDVAPIADWLAAQTDLLFVNLGGPTHEGWLQAWDQRADDLIVIEDARRQLTLAEMAGIYGDGSHTIGVFVLLADVDQVLDPADLLALQEVAPLTIVVPPKRGIPGAALRADAGYRQALEAVWRQAGLLG